MFNSGGNDVLAIPGPPSQPTVDVLDIRLAVVSSLFDKDENQRG